MKLVARPCALFLALMIVGVPSVVPGAEAAENPDEFDRAIAACVKSVHRELPGSVFDAYANHEGKVHNFGTERDRFKFEKCMSQSGHPLEIAR